MSDASNRVVRFLLTGDAAGALRAQEETAKGFEKTSKSADDTGKHVGLLEKTFGSMKSVIGYTAGAAGIGGLVFGIKDVINSGKQWEEQQAQLQTALRNTGQMSNHAMGELNKSAERSTVHGGFAPTEELGGLAQLTRLTGSYTNAMKLNASVVNLARGAHIDYSAALKIVAKAQTGTAGKAQAYLGIIQPVKTAVDALTAAEKKQNPQLLRHAELLDKHATSMEINRVIFEKYKNSADAFSKTVPGKLSNFSHLIDLIMEKLSKKLMPVIGKVVEVASEGAQWIIKHWSQISGVVSKVFSTVWKILKTTIGVIASIIKWIVKNREVFEALAIGVAAVAIPIAAYSAATIAATAITTAFGTAVEFAADMLFLATSPISLIVIGLVALAAGVAYAYMHFKTFRDVVNTVFSAVKTVVVTAVDFIIEHWKLFLAGFSFPILIVVEIIKNFTKIKTGVESVFKGIGSFVGGIFDGIVNGVIKGVNLIIKAINFVIKAYNDVPSFFRPTGKIGTIGEIGELGKHSPAVATAAHSTPHSAVATAAHSTPHSAGRTHLHLHTHVEMNGREFAKALVKDPQGMKTLSEGLTLTTAKRAARA